ncbi:MAG: nucleoside phosphorylase [Sedimentisphaerales bacterium]|nr:nucleoside phosphorylase [Sedimentisphaerales bacterium]
MNNELPLLESFSKEKAIIEPAEVLTHPDMPEMGIICFKPNLDKLVSNYPHKELEPLRTAMGELPVYEIEWKSKQLAVFCPGITAPLAVALTEEVIARGCRKLIAFGGAGVLDREMIRGHLVVPTCAVRDEGTSFHYAAPSREIVADEAGLVAIKAVLSEQDIPFTLGKTWTTDAFYRETPSRITRRKAEGCLTIEMEAAALFALAQFRCIAFGQILICGDDVSGNLWDARNTHPQANTSQAVFELAVEACIRL